MNYIRLFLFSRAPRRCWARRGAPRRTRNGEPPNEGAAESISFSRAVPAPPRRRPPPAPAPPPARARGPAGPPGAAAPAHPRPARRGPAPRDRPSAEAPAVRARYPLLRSPPASTASSRVTGSVTRVVRSPISNFIINSLRLRFARRALCSTGNTDDANDTKPASSSPTILHLYTGEV